MPVALRPMYWPQPHSALWPIESGPGPYPSAGYPFAFLHLAARAITCRAGGVDHRTLLQRIRETIQIAGINVGQSHSRGHPPRTTGRGKACSIVITFRLAKGD